MSPFKFSNIPCGKIAPLAAGLLFLSAALLLPSCGGTGTGAKPGNTSREANLPLYFTVSGSALGEGAIYKLQSLSQGSLSSPELVASGLDFPAGVTVDSRGDIYFAEKLPSPDGKVKKIERGGTQAETVLTGLHNPVSVAVDSFNHIYVNESDRNKISRSDPAGNMKDFKSDEIALPRDMLFDPDDRLILTELESGTVSSLDPSGQRTVLITGLSNPFGIALGPTNDIYAIVNGSGASDGSIIRVVGAGATEVVVDGLTNPIALTYNNAHGFFIIEGSPANRIINYSLKTGRLTIVALTGENPYGLAMTPL